MNEQSEGGGSVKCVLRGSCPSLQSHKKLPSVTSQGEESGSSSGGTSMDDPEAVAADKQSRPWSKRWAKGPSPNANAMIAKEAYGASWGLQYVTLLRRALKVRRFEALSVQDMTQAIAVAVLAGPPLPLLPCSRLGSSCCQAVVSKS